MTPAGRTEAEPRAPGKVGPPCPNCGAVDMRRYCPDCGQAAPDASDYSISAHALEFVAQTMSTDGKALRTFRTLLLRPGALTTDHLRGRRVRYLSPIQLFLLVNLVLFLIAPRVPLFSYNLAQYLQAAPPSASLAGTLVERAQANGGAASTPALRDATAYEAAFDARVETQRKGLIILFAPALALVLRVLFPRRAAASGRPRRYGEHLVFALHTLAFVWLALSLAYGVAVMAGRAFGPVVGVVGGLAAVVILLAVTPVYVVLALRRAYELPLSRALAVGGALVAAFFLLIGAYRGLLFFTTYYTLCWLRAAAEQDSIVRWLAIDRSIWTARTRAPAGAALRRIRTTATARRPV
jgi:hypothetical protein